MPFESVRVVQGDTDAIPFGRGTSGSRSLPVGGPAVKAACAALIARGEPLARSLLQAGSASALRCGAFTFGEGTGMRGIGLLEMARALVAPENQPAGERWPVLEASGRYKLEASTFPTAPTSARSKSIRKPA